MNQGPKSVVVRSTITPQGKHRFEGKCSIHFRHGEDGRADNTIAFSVVSESESAAVDLLEGYMLLPPGVVPAMAVELVRIEAPKKQTEDRNWRGTVEVEGELRFECEARDIKDAKRFTLAYLRRVGIRYAMGMEGPGQDRTSPATRAATYYPGEPQRVGGGAK